MNRLIPLRRALIVLCILSPITGCKEVLYSGLTEPDANEMVAMLSLSEIPARRERDKDGVYAIMVESRDVSAATIYLRNAGLPRRSFQDLGDVFSASGIIGTPFEQHARYIHAMNQEISHMLSNIDGVNQARVIVNAPPAGRYDREPPKASAAVTVHHEDDFSVADNIPKIKQIVSHSVPNLTYEGVSVSFFREPTLEVEPLEPEAFQALSTANVLKLGHLGALRDNVFLAGLLSVAALGLAASVARRLMRAPPPRPDFRSMTDMTGRR